MKSQTFYAQIARTVIVEPCFLVSALPALETTQKGVIHRRKAPKRRSWNLGQKNPIEYL